MIVIPIPMYPLYIKKEDARDVVKWQRKMAAFVLIGITIVMGIMQYFVSPKLLNLYNSLNTNPPALTQSSLYIMIALGTLAILSALYLLFSQPNYAKVDAVANKYKDGEMIKTKELVDGKFQWLVLGVLSVMVVYLVFTIILPIYSLTSQY